MTTSPRLPSPGYRCRCCSKETTAKVATVVGTVAAAGTTVLAGRALDHATRAIKLVIAAVFGVGVLVVIVSLYWRGRRLRIDI